MMGATMKGLFIGRFQPFHNGHLHVVKIMSKECSEIIIGVGSAEKQREPNNPLSGGERIEMIRNVLINHGIDDFQVYPVPDIDCYPEWPYYVKSILPDFDVVYVNSDLVMKLFSQIGVKVRLVEDVNRDIWRGQEIRQSIRDGGDWEEYVPKETADFLKTIDMGSILKHRISKNPDTERMVAQLLTKKNKTVATAESCTGGLIADRLTDIPGSSTYFMGGIVAYNNTIKIEHLGVDKELIDNKGAVSQEVAVAMARGICKLFKTDLGLAVTGIAGPGGGSREKPVGTVYFSISEKDKILESGRFNLEGSRRDIKQQVSEKILNHLIKQLNDS